ncbi:MAG: MmcQ/YjbR family DNA-binding protein [Acetatifactor sp.]|nr:MmcQ/YjbR family DNA-binding protein [Acetatifactor sp.]
MNRENELINGSLREAVLNYVKKKYKSRIEYLWKTSPDAAVFRHEDNQKWYGLVMEVSRSKFGFPEEGYVCTLNVKTDDPMLHDILLQQNGFFPGYHMSKKSWISILLDGTVPFDRVCDMIDMSYQATASKEKKAKLRPPKEWIIPANPKYYDIEHAFDATDVIDWKQGNGIKSKDTVFLYVAAPISAILYKCKVLETDIPHHYQDENLTIKSLMKIKLLKRYKPDRFPFDKLKAEYNIFAVRGPRGIPDRLSQDLKKRSNGAPERV